MKHKLYNFIQLALLLVISSVSAFALSNNAIENYRSNVVRDAGGKVLKYSVLVASVGNPKNNSDFSEHYVQRVDEKYYVKGQIYVKTKVKTDNGKDNLLQGASALSSALQAVGSSKITAFADAKQVEKNPGLKNYGLDRLYKVNIPIGKDPFEVCAELMKNPDVEYACPVSKSYKNTEKPNDQYVDAQYALSAMNVFEAWEYTKGNPDIKIAIVDSGTDYTHPDLAANIWTNPSDPENGLDDDENGKVDDTHGWDFVANYDIESIMNDVFQEDNDPNNRVNTHGTMTAGCAGAVSNNQIGVAGVAYQCKLIPVKIGSDLPQMPALFQTYEGVRYAAELGAEIINCSWGGYLYSPAEQDIITYVTFDKNSIVVAAAGNESNNNDEMPSYPATYKHVLSVGASDQQNKLADFSNYGYLVTTFAPGVDILTTDANARLRRESGTSFSCPNVSGVVALVKSIHPEWGPKKLYHQIRSTSDRISGGNKPYEYFGTVNAEKAVTWNSANSDITVPGMAIEDFYINNESHLKTITTEEEFELFFLLKNYLSMTENLKIKAFSPDGVLKIDSKQVTIQTLEEDGSALVSFKAKLSEKNPWSEGYAMVVLEYSGANGKYSDYQMVKVPLKISSVASTFISNELIPANTLFSSAANTNVAWGVGVNNSLQVLATRFNVAKNELQYYLVGSALMPSAIAAIDNDNAYVAVMNPLTGYSAIMKTDNAGKDFDDRDISSIAKKVNAIYFKDKSTGMFIGSPSGGKWGIATTRNGGYSWEPASKPPFAGFNDEMNEVAHACTNNTVYFGSTNGKIFRSDDFGDTWAEKKSVSGRVHSMAFLDENVGIVVHLNNKVQISLTVDGGNSWKPVVQDLIGKFALVPVIVYADKVSRSFVIVNRNGAIYQSTDFCKSWSPIKKHRNFRVSSSSAYINDDGDVAVFQFGGFKERVLYHSEKSNKKPEIAVKEGANIDLGNLEVNKTKNTKFNLENTGSDIAVVTGYELKMVKGEESEITLKDSPNIALIPGEVAGLNLKFAPVSEGDKEALLTVIYGTDKVEVKIIGSSKKVNDKGKLTVAAGFNLDFGDVEINTKKEKVLKIDNTSNTDVVVSDVKIKPAGSNANEVTLKGSKAVTIKANSSYDFVFEFNATTLGKKIGYIEIENDGEVNPIKMQYSANVIEKTSVKESNMFATAKVMPNPATNSCQLILGENADKVKTISIYSADGRLLLQVEPNFNNNILDINTSTIPAGQYNIILQGTGISESVKLIVIK